jgi:hypothetical protein
VEVAEDAVTDADDAGRLTLDEDPERVPIAGQDGFDCGALIRFLEGVGGGRRRWFGFRDGTPEIDGTMDGASVRPWSTLPIRRARRRIP